MASVANQVALDDLLVALRAAGEPTRLRLLALLNHGELNVKDLTRILGQSQPRISRHLKLLTDAGLIERFREGSWVYFRLSSSGQAGTLTRQLLDTLDDNDPVLARDLQRAEEAKADRARLAQDYFRAHAAEWDEIRTLHIPDDRVEHAMLAALGKKPLNLLLDVGTGTGRILELFSEHYREGLGIDINTDMLAYARAKLEAVGVSHAQVRQGDLYNLPLEDGTADGVIIHQVLHFLESPAHALGECARVLAPGGQLLIVDFAAHDLEHLREDFAHRRLGFDTGQIRRWAADLELELTRHDELVPEPRQTDGKLTVCLWRAEKPGQSKTDNVRNDTRAQSDKREPVIG